MPQAVATWTSWPRRSIIETLSPLCHRIRVDGADPRQEAQRFLVAPHEDVLAVVDLLAGRRISEGRGPPAKIRTRFEHKHAGAGLGQRGRRTQSCETRTDDGSVKHHNATTKITKDISDQ